MNRIERPYSGERSEAGACEEEALVPWTQRNAPQRRHRGRDEKPPEEAKDRELLPTRRVRFGPCEDAHARETELRADHPQGRARTFAPRNRRRR